MVNNIITYVQQYGKHSVAEFPFNEVDALVLCQLSYLDFSASIYPETERKDAVLISEIAYLPRVERLYEGFWYKDENRELFRAVSESTRFGSMRLWRFEELKDEDRTLQFAALTFAIDKDTDFVAFRGTDASLIGWKEDLMLAYSRPTGAQKHALKYLTGILESTDGHILAGGHSKGGNLAVYAAMNLPRDLQERIDTVYDNDGPGFRPEILEQSDYENIRGRIRKFIPHSSVVGVILEENDDYELIECWKLGTLQHNTYTWKSEKGAFLRASGIDPKKRIRDAALNEWILSLSEEEITVFIDTLYEFLTSEDSESLYDLKNNLKKSIIDSFRISRDLDENTKKALQNILKSFIDIYGEHAAAEVANMRRSFREELRSLYLGAADLLSRKNT